MYLFLLLNSLNKDIYTKIILSKKNWECEWVKKFWKNVRSEIMVKSFKKCGISNVIDGTEYNPVKQWYQHWYQE